MLLRIACRIEAREMISQHGDKLEARSRAGRSERHRPWRISRHRRAPIGSNIFRHCIGMALVAMACRRLLAVGVAHEDLIS